MKLTNSMKIGRDTQEEKSEEPMVEEQTEEESVSSAIGGEKGIRLSNNVTHAAAPEKKKTICGWRYRRDTDWSIQPVFEPISFGKVSTICEAEDEVQVGRVGKWDLRECVL